MRKRLAIFPVLLVVHRPACSRDEVIGAAACGTDRLVAGLRIGCSGRNIDPIPWRIDTGFVNTFAEIVFCSARRGSSRGPRGVGTGLRGMGLRPALSRVSIQTARVCLNIGFVARAQRSVVLQYGQCETLEDSQVGQQIRFLIGGQLGLQNQVEELHRVIESQQTAVVQIGR